MVRLVLADDHPVVREGLRALLDTQEDLRVVGEASDGLDAIRQVEQTRPDVLCTDLMMPRLGGLEVTRHVRQRFPKTRVLILSMYGSDAHVLAALRNGAAGYVLKGSSSAEIVRAIHMVAAGTPYLSPPFAEHAIDAYVTRSAETPADPYESLTPREQEVLQLTAEGHSNPTVAGYLGISLRTAETHRASLMRKLGLHSQADVMHYALERGLLVPPSLIVGEESGATE
jgi:DNA-binding NarL/FixJ family response regulator